MIGAGGLGSPLALYLAAAGVGRSAWWTSTSWTRATCSARCCTPRPRGAAQARLRGRPAARREPARRGRAHDTRLTSDNAFEFLGATIWWWTAPTTSRRATWSTTPACCWEADVYGSIFRFEGQVSVFGARRPVLPLPLPPASAAGIGAELRGGRRAGRASRADRVSQAMEAIKLILGIGEPLVGRLALFDGLAFEWREVSYGRTRSAPCAGSTDRDGPNRLR